MADIDDTRKNTNGLRRESSSQEPKVSAGTGEILGQMIDVPIRFMKASDWSEQNPIPNQNSYEIWVDENYNVISPGDPRGIPISKKKIYDPRHNDIIWQGDGGGVLPPGHIDAVPVSQEKIRSHQGWAFNGNGERVYLDVGSMPEGLKKAWQDAGMARELERAMGGANNRYVQDFNEADVNLLGIGGQIRTDRFGHTTWGVNYNPLNTGKGFSIGIGVGNVVTPDGRRLSSEAMRNQSMDSSASVGASGGLLTANYSTPTDSRFYPEVKTGMSTQVLPSASVAVSRMEEAPGWVTRMIRPILQPTWNGLTEEEAYLLLETFKRNQHPFLKTKQQALDNEF